MAKCKKFNKKQQTQDPQRPAIVGDCPRREHDVPSRQKKATSAVKRQASTPIIQPYDAQHSESLAANTLLPMPFPTNLPRPPNHDFLLNQPPYQESFEEALKTSYEGFMVDEKPLEGSNLSADQIVDRGLETMQRQNYFRRDVTQPFGLGTPCAKTYVTRCLVGDPGTTYKYLGLRMFAHPWKITTESSDGDDKAINQKNSRKRQRREVRDPTDQEEAALRTIATTKEIRLLGERLSERTRTHLETLNQQRKQRNAPLTQGRAKFDICLINRMDPQEKLKNESSQVLPQLGTSVSWHADSSLEHYSTIAVYQTLLEDTQKKDPGIVKSKKKKKSSGSEEVSSADRHKDQWYVALRVAPHCEGPTVNQRKTTIQEAVDTSIPPIAAALPTGSAYYLLDDFNHHHQHTVLKSGDVSSIRYSCTFRLLRDSHNVEYVIRRCQSVVSQFHKKGSKIWRSEQLLLTDVESEWIRQFYIQGYQHHELLWDAYWKGPIQMLLKYWSQLEQRTFQTYELLQYAAQGKCRTHEHNNSSEVQLDKKERKLREKQMKAFATVQALRERSQGEDIMGMYEGMAKLLEERARLRELWSKRERDHVFSEMAPELRPIPVPFSFQDGKADMQSTIDVANSPLPGKAENLQEIATSLRKFGQAFVSGRIQDLPMAVVLKSNSSTNLSPVSGDSSAAKDNQHSKPIDWPGWGQENFVFGLEMQDPWASVIVEGRKEIETRAYNLPPALLGRRIWIIESPRGTPGVSAVGNVIDFQQQQEDYKIIGWCTFGSVIRYQSRAAFEADEKRHLVTPDSGYCWKDGQREILYGWVVRECKQSVDKSFSLATRRMRSLFELTVKPNNKKRRSSKKNLPKSGLQKKRRY